MVKKDNKFINEIFHLNEEKKDPSKNLKNRDLLNPNRYKRKNAGAKIGTPKWSSFFIKLKFIRKLEAKK